MGQIHDDLYEVLSNAQRRELLFALLEESPRTDTPRELDPPSDTTDTDGGRSVERYHVHLPKLDEHGFIEWKPDIGCVERGPRFDEIKPLLNLLAEYHMDSPKTA